MVTDVTQSAKKGPPATQSYFSLIRRLNLLRQIAEFRTEHGWTKPGSLLERTRRFFHARGSIPYHFEAPILLSKYTRGELTNANVFFGPPGSKQIVVFAHRSLPNRNVLIHVQGDEVKEYENFELDQRFGSARTGSITSLFGWKVRHGTIDQYVNPVEFDDDTAVITIRVNIVLENGPGHEMPAQLVGQPQENGYRWSITRIGNAHDWYPDTNTKLFFPGYEPQEVVYGSTNETFVCKGMKRIGNDEDRWAVWNDRWEGTTPSPLIEGVPSDRIGTLAVSTFGMESPVYSFALDKLDSDHPLSPHTPGLVMAREPGQFCVIPLEGVASIQDVLAIHVAGPRAGIFHTTRQGPTDQIAIHQNGVPIGSPLDDLHYYGMFAEDPIAGDNRVRVSMVVADDGGRRLSLYTASSTAWPETLDMMGVSLHELNRQITSQEKMLDMYRRNQSGKKSSVLGLDRVESALNQQTVHSWWNYISSRVERTTGLEIGPYVCRETVIRLLDDTKDSGGVRRLEPLLAPLADIFNVEASVIGNLETDDEVIRLRRDVSKFLEDRGLILRASTVNPSKGKTDSDPVLLVLHPTAADWREATLSDSELLTQVAAAG
jgi:hypothetical protein